MAQINVISCDGPGCFNKVDMGNYGSSTYHHLSLGGTDFEMSFGNDREFDFCSIECLQKFLKRLVDETQ